MSQNQTNKLQSWQVILAGGTAGGVESLVTYPTEYVKTRQQLYGQKSSALKILQSTIREHGVRRIYTGAGVFCISNSSKSAVRFFAFDAARNAITRNSNISSTSPVCTMLAGFCAGTAESVTVLTPGENLKTKMIDERAKGTSSSSLRHAVRNILAKEGVFGFYRGIVPVTMKQSGNSVVRFTSYQIFLDKIKSLGQRHTVLNNAAAPALAGGLAGIVTVYATMPFDNVKTKMQAIGGKEAYNGSIDCVRKIVQGEGFLALWKGTTPRLLRLSISGALAFSIYESVTTWTQQLRYSRLNIETVEQRAGL